MSTVVEGSNETADYDADNETEIAIDQSQAAAGGAAAPSLGTLLDLLTLTGTLFVCWLIQFRFPFVRRINLRHTNELVKQTCTDHWSVGNCSCSTLTLNVSG